MEVKKQYVENSRDPREASRSRNSIKNYISRDSKFETEPSRSRLFHLSMPPQSPVAASPAHSATSATQYTPDGYVTVRA